MTTSIVSTVSKTESMVLIKNMMRISISSICYFRDIFPSDCFKDKQYGTVNIHQLQGAFKDEKNVMVVKNKEAFLLTQWLERGVFAALESEYLSSMLFAIYTKHPVTQADLLLESYEFKITYAGNGKAAKINNADLHSKDAVKSQAAKFIRCLTEFTSTLEELPRERWLTIQLKYYDHTPADYEPEYFGPALDNLLAGLSLPLVINVGNLDTAEMNLKVKFAGLESLLIDDLRKIQPQQNAQSSAPSIFKAKSHKDDETERTSYLCSEEPDRANLLTHLNREAALHSEFQRMTVLEDSSNEEGEAFRQVKAFILNERCPVISKCCAKLKLDVTLVRKAFQDLLKAGILRMQGKMYQIAEPQPSTDCQTLSSTKQLQDTEATMMEEMPSFGSNGSDEERNFVPPQQPTRKPTRQPPSRLPSKTLKMDAHSSRVEKESTASIGLSQSSEVEAPNGKKRKYSIVQDPIQVEGSNGRKKASI